ncbi:probable N-acetyltransferase HLS1-like [Andrographis paniculata]|uniref:probable N-acetyltransferase HLS1-like n=1 Tax=Andrographis paniculata TaxID=175694 RepID=UPI0021E7DB90|nr:probable N-acetyltransferase HLS1-like [Andrographis paniculata]
MILKKIAAVEEAAPVAVIVREYCETRDKAAVVELERRCEIGQPGKPSLVTDLKGDPIARVRNFVSHTMLVAEYGQGREIVGVIRGCIKTVTNGKLISSTQLPVHVNLAYILGLRVSSTHRRLGIATKLVEELENWCKKNGAEYAYMATECSNHPSLNLFTKKCNYVKFRNPMVLVQPVHRHAKPLPSDIAIVRVPTSQAEHLYRRAFSFSEFFPKDINQLLTNKLNLGTFMALPKKFLSEWNPNSENFDFPHSFAILSVWNAKEVYRLRVKGVSRLTHAVCFGTRVVDAMIPWLKIPSVPNVFRDFGFHFMHGLHMEGDDGPRMMTTLCKFVYNMARKDGDSRVVVAEVGQADPVRRSIPHWKKFSWDEDVWCIKKLGDEGNAASREDWCKSTTASPSSVIFVDPRDL